MESRGVRNTVTVKHPLPPPPPTPPAATTKNGSTTTTTNTRRGGGNGHHGNLSLDTTTSSGSPLNSLQDGGGGGSVSGISPAPEHGGEQQRASKIAACLSCRRSKVRCEKGPDASRCRKCAAANTECIRPMFNVGRRKGVKK